MHHPHEDKWVYLTTQNSFQRAQIAGNVKSTQTFYCELTRYHSSGHLSLADLVWLCMNSFLLNTKGHFWIIYLFIFFSNPAFSKAPTASTIQASALPRRQTGHSRTRSKSRAKICHSICQSGRRGHNLLWLAAYLSRYSPALEERQKQEEAYAGSSYNTDLVVGWI